MAKSLFCLARWLSKSVREIASLNGIASLKGSLGRALSFNLPLNRLMTITNNNDDTYNDLNFLDSEYLEAKAFIEECAQLAK